MSKSRKLPPKRTGTSIVTERRLAVLLSNWAKAADAAFSVKIAEMEDRLRAEFTVVVPPKEAVAAAIVAAIAAEPLFGSGPEAYGEAVEEPSV